MAKKTSADRIVLVGGGLVATVLVAYLGISYKYFNDEPTGCMASYPQAVRFGLQNRDGRALSMIELQAVAGREERGLMQNARIVTADDAPTPRVLEVNLGRADASDPGSPIGIHFPWRPDGSNDARSACLRYSVLLPEDFDFSAGGVLPGLFGGAMPGRSELANESGFVLRTRWGNGGEAQISVQSGAVSETGRAIVSQSGSVRLKRGHWVTLEQELVLNTAGANNGEVRVWLDGTKVVEKKELKVRGDDASGINGVDATVGIAGNPKDVAAGDHARLKISAWEFGWR
jgi:hypothetical protein